MNFRALVLAALIHPLCALAAEIHFEKADAFPAEAYPLIADKRVVWLGEMHGSSEPPEFLLGLVKLVSRHEAAPPLVALEISAIMQPFMDRFMASGDDAILRESPFFSHKVKDGRQSQALVRFLHALRKEKIAGVVCFDVGRDYKDAQERDTIMAETIQTWAKKFPSAKVLALSGSIHSMTSVYELPDNPRYRPAAMELQRLMGNSVMTLNIVCQSGTAWYLNSSGFAERPLLGKWRGPAPFHITVDPTLVPGHHGIIFARTLTGSPPW